MSFYSNLKNEVNEWLTIKEPSGWVGKLRNEVDDWLHGAGTLIGRAGEKIAMWGATPIEGIRSLAEANKSLVAQLRDDLVARGMIK